MGILELHFHDSEFVFGPSIGGEDASETAADAVDEMVQSDSDGTTKSPALAVVVGLLFALVLAALAKKVGGGGDHDGVEVEELEP